jgi:hypothetical protein
MRTFLRTVSLTVVVLVAAPAAAHAARGMEISVQDEPVLLHQAYYDREQAFERMRQLQVTRIRVNLLWNKALVAGQANLRTPPLRPQYDFSRYDDLIDAAARHGIRVHMSIAGPAPAYATSNRRIGTLRPNASLYGSFVSVAARHFRGRVDRYSIFNEPNLKGWLTPVKDSPVLYRKLYTAGYRAIKAADPRAQVLIGETVPYGSRIGMAPIEFLRKMLCVEQLPERRSRRNGDDDSGRERTRSSQRRRRLEPDYVKPRYRRVRRCALKADGYAHHPYDFGRPIAPPDRIYEGNDNATLGTLHHLTDALDELARLRVLRTPRGRRLDVHLTEYGYFAVGRRHVPESRRAVYLKRAFQIAQRNPRVRSLLQYVLVEPPPGYPGGYFDLSILERDGRAKRPFTSLVAWARAAALRGLVKRPGGSIGLPPAPSM